MCGILASVNSRLEDDEKLVEALALTHHRGPDFSNSERIRNLWLGHNRLSIIDLDERANQPMIHDNQGLIYNGEIFNFKKLRAELGLTDLTTDSDTEVLLNGLKLKGIEFLRKVEGFFAFVYFDSNTNKILVARDRLGQKPLFYAQLGESLYFSSEQKVLKKILNSKIDPYNLLELVISGLPSGGSYLEGIEEVQPGEFLEFNFEGKLLDRTLWFDLKHEIYQKRHDFNKFSYEDHVALFREELVDSVRDRLVSDVEVVTINSGGLDSSLISSLANSTQSGIKMYSLDVQGKSEIEFAKIVSTHLKADLEVVEFCELDYKELYDEAAGFLDGPMVHPNNVAIFKLAKQISLDGFKVVLSGEIADELFFGYPSMNSFFNKRAALKCSRMVSEIFNRLPDQIKEEIFGVFKLFARESSDSILNIVREQHLARRIRFDEVVSEFRDFMPNKQAYAAAIRLSALEQYLPPLLKRGDQMFMGNSVEARMPFSSTKLILHSFYTPEKGISNKKILRDVAQKFLPKEIINRKKIGLPINIKSENRIRIVEEIKSIFQ